MWELTLRGGAFHGCRGECEEPSEVLIVWGDKTDMWATADPGNPYIVFKTAEAYRLVERCEDECRAAYEVGEDAPRPEVVEVVSEPLSAARTRA